MSKSEGSLIEGDWQYQRGEHWLDEIIKTPKSEARKSLQEQRVYGKNTPNPK